MTTKQSPCAGCSERFIACSDRCPKDARGEYGYKSWKADLAKIKQAEKEYKRQSREEFLRSETKEYHCQKYISSKYGRNIWKDNAYKE